MKDTNLNKRQFRSFSDIASVQGDSKEANQCRRVNALENFNRLRRAIVTYHSGSDDEIDAELKRIGPGKRACTKTLYMSPYAKLEWLKLILDAFKKLKFDTSKMYFVTLIDERWFATLEDWDGNLRQMRKHISRGLKGVDHFGMIELAIFPRIRGDKGFLVSLHYHGIAINVESRIRAFQHARKVFSGGLGGSHGVDVQKVHDLDGALDYCFKAPFYGYRFNERADGTNKHRTVRFSDKGLWRIYMTLRNVRFSDLMIRGGYGNEVARLVRAAASRAAFSVKRP